LSKEATKLEPGDEAELSGVEQTQLFEMPMRPQAEDRVETDEGEPEWVAEARRPETAPPVQSHRE
jgi:hypothetical protein